MKGGPIVKPRALRAGGHVRVLSLSAPVAAACPRRYARACRALRELGYRVSEGAMTRRWDHHRAGSAAARARDFVEAWLDDDVDAILSVIGGACTHQILEHLPFPTIAAAPAKPLIGYSDTTTLMMALYARCRLVSFHGPALMPQFGEPGGIDPYALESLRRAVRARPGGELPEAEGHVDEQLPWDRRDDHPRALIAGSTRRCLRPGRAAGRVVAVNMGCLLLLAGTRYFPPLDGAILVLEDDEEERPESIDRYLTQMRHLGVWARISGLVIGRFPKEVDLPDALLDELVLEATAGTTFPILAGFEVGHVDPALTIPIGVEGELDAGQRRMRLLEPACVAARGRSTSPPPRQEKASKRGGPTAA